MNTEERVKRAIEIFDRAGPTQDLRLYLQKLKEDDPLAFSFAEVYVHSMRNQFPQVIRKGTRLIPRLGGQNWLAWRLFLSIGVAYGGIGEIETGETYLMRALEIGEAMGDRSLASQAKLQIYITRFFRAEYEEAYRGFLICRKELQAPDLNWADYFLALCSLIKGRPEESSKIVDRLLSVMEKGLLWFDAMEIKAFVLRISGKFPEAMEAFLESLTGYIGYESAYSAFPLAKALELSRLAGLEPPPRKLIRKALSLARKGSWGEQAAAEEIEALLREDDAEAAEGLYGAAKNYLRAYQNTEAVFSGLTAAYLAWRSDSPVFTKALKLIAPLVPLHPGFKKDPLLGDFISKLETFLGDHLKPSQTKEGIRAYLIGQCRVTVDGKDIKLSGWRRNRAIKALLYLLLSPKHRIPTDHIFYLLWPRRSYNKKSRWGLYKAIDTARKHLGRRELLTKKRDFYQLEEAWTDLGELENLVRLAEAATDPAQREEYLARARELARGELLPEFPYDKHIDEYRQYYERLRRKIFKEGRD